MRRSASSELAGLSTPVRAVTAGFAASMVMAKPSALTRKAEPIEDCLLRAPDGTPCLEAHTPVELERELAMPGGNIFHRDLQWPWAEDAAEAGTWGTETGVPTVHLCGSGARRGGAVSGIPGHNAARAVLEALAR